MRLAIRHDLLYVQWISHRKEPIAVLQGAELIIKEQRTELNYYQIDPRMYTFDQTIMHTNEIMMVGNQILHLNVPRHIHIIDTSGRLTTLN